MVYGNDIRFRELSASAGISQTRVSYVVQDGLGFLWFGTPSRVESLRWISILRNLCAGSRSPLMRVFDNRPMVWMRSALGSPAKSLSRWLPKLLAMTAGPRNRAGGGFSLAPAATGAETPRGYAHPVRLFCSSVCRFCDECRRIDRAARSKDTWV